MLVIRCLILLFAIALMPMIARATDEPETGFVSRSVTVKKTAYNYKVFVPENWTEKKKWPVILFLHGAGERGSDNTAQAAIGIGPAIRREPDKFPFVVVMPQCSTGRWWPEPDMREMALKALKQTMKEFRGDKERVYLTGLSMGGYGTWAIAFAHQGKFAAYAPICGGVRAPSRVLVPLAVKGPESEADPYLAVAKAVGKTPVWVFHGGADPVVPVSESRKMVEALKATGGRVRYSEYEGVGHNSWDRAYSEPELFSWMLSCDLKSNRKKR